MGQINKGGNEHIERVRVDPSDPERCVHTNAAGIQCCYKSIEGEDYCPKHSSPTRARAQSLKLYQLTRFKARVTDLATNPAIKSLREEIGILRMTLEAALNLYESEAELVMNVSSISSLVSQVNNLVGSCHKLEMQTDQLLDKNQAMLLADQIIAVLTDHVSDAATLNSMALKIGKLFEEVKYEE